MYPKDLHPAHDYLVPNFFIIIIITMGSTSPNTEHYFYPLDFALVQEDLECLCAKWNNDIYISPTEINP